MAVIVDRRGSNKKRLAGSRAKFIQRYKKHIKSKIDRHIKNTDIKDIGDDVQVNIDKDSIKEERLHYDEQYSDRRKVLPGNSKYNKGDKESISSGEGARAGKDGISEDDFRFILTKEEFLDILFEDMALPNFVKKNNLLSHKLRYITAGYIKDGVPTRLAIKKTMEVSVARRLAFKGMNPNKKPRFIDDTDLRYRHITTQIQPVARAVMFCIMDVSGSMSERHKLIAKKFFLLLYLFLNKCYKHVEIRFISHTHIAQEVDEHTFFYSKETGGTMVSPAIELAKSIIEKEYDVETTNIYIAQASDGDNWGSDEDDLYVAIEKILPLVQYFAYVEIDNRYPGDGVCEFYNNNFEDEKLNTAIIDKEEDVIEVLRNLFKKGS